MNGKNKITDFNEPFQFAQVSHVKECIRGKPITVNQTNKDYSENRTKRMDDTLFVTYWLFNFANVRTQSSKRFILLSYIASNQQVWNIKTHQN